MVKVPSRGFLSGKNKRVSGQYSIWRNRAFQDSGKRVDGVYHGGDAQQLSLERDGGGKSSDGKPEATAEEMRAALKKVNLLAFLDTQQGFETPLTEKAGNLSGGQKQRLALARALLHDTPVYIFDEATSNIDMESEEMIMEVIRELAKDQKRCC